MNSKSTRPRPSPELKPELKIPRQDIEEAYRRIQGRIRRTPVAVLEPGAFDIPCRMSLKLELLQHTGSFKPRGAFNRILSAPIPGSGVVAASGGNFGLAVAYAARALGHRAEIFVPRTSSQVKVDQLRRLGVVVRVEGASYAEALDASTRRAEETGALVMHAYDQPEVVAGQGTIGLELSEQAPSIDTVMIAVGGGGLIAGVASWFERAVRVIGVEPERAPTLHEALRAGRIVDVDVGGIAADSLGARRAGQIAFDVARQHVDRVVLVSDDAILQAQRRLWEEAHVLAEPGGAAALAALLSTAYRPSPDERVCIVVCGGNTDPAALTLRDRGTSA